MTLQSCTDLKHTSPSSPPPPSRKESDSHSAPCTFVFNQKSSYWEGTHRPSGLPLLLQRGQLTQLSWLIGVLLVSVSQQASVLLGPLLHTTHALDVSTIILWIMLFFLVRISFAFAYEIPSIPSDYIPCLQEASPNSVAPVHPFLLPEVRLNSMNLCNHLHLRCYLIDS
jgi:hypothetical protein